MKKIAVLLICTGKYKQFVEPLLKGLNENFLRNHQVIVHLFIDEYFSKSLGQRIGVAEHLIPSYRFPEATLYRYKIFSEHSEWLMNYDYLFYLDIDMAIEQEVGEEIFGHLTAVHHPGFYINKGWGSQAVDPRSKAFIPKELWKEYFAGGFQGGETTKYLEVCKLLADNIKDDESRGILAEWHDESHWCAFLNKTLKEMHPDWVLNKLTPEYCNVPRMHQREMWGIQDLPAKIVALDKDHIQLRS